MKLKHSEIERERETTCRCWLIICVHIRCKPHSLCVSHIDMTWENFLYSEKIPSNYTLTLLWVTSQWSPQFFLLSFPPWWWRMSVVKLSLPWLLICLSVCVCMYSRGRWIVIVINVNIDKLHSRSTLNKKIRHVNGIEIFFC